MNQMGTSNLANIENWTRRFLRMSFRLSPKVIFGA